MVMGGGWVMVCVLFVFFCLFGFHPVFFFLVFGWLGGGGFLVSNKNPRMGWKLVVSERGIFTEGVAAPRGRIYFFEDVFSSSLQVSEHPYITITTLPEN